MSSSFPNPAFLNTHPVAMLAFLLSLPLDFAGLAHGEPATSVWLPSPRILRHSRQRTTSNTTHCAHWSDAEELVAVLCVRLRAGRNGLASGCPHGTLPVQLCTRQPSWRAREESSVDNVAGPPPKAKCHRSTRGRHRACAFSLAQGLHQFAASSRPSSQR